MKKITFLIALFVANFSFGQLNIIENFDYADETSLASTSNWTNFGGTEDQIKVSSGQIVLKDSDTEDVAILIDDTVSDIYFAFDFSLTKPGNFTSTNDFEYFAHVVDNGGFNFRGRLYLAEYSETGFTPGITANKWKDGEEEVTKWGEELSYDTVYRAVIRYNGTATLWINPTASTSTSVTTTADATNGSVDVTSVNFRQGGASPDYTVTVDNVAVTESFNSAILTLDKNEAVSNIVVTVSNGVVTSNRGEIVAVYNTLGQKVANANLQGVYIVRVQDGAQVKAVKVLVK